MIILGIIGVQEIILILIVLLFMGLLPLLALIDILRSEFTSNNKLIWILVVLFAITLGSILYFILGGKNKSKGNVL